MPRLLTLFLMLHWATVFSLLAALSISDLSGVEGLRAFGLALSFEGLDEASTLALRAATSFAFTVCAVLFWWSLATIILSSKPKAPQGDDVLRVAFAAATWLMTFILVVGAIGGAGDLLPIMATHVAVLIASYVAIQTERDRLPLPAPVREEELRLAARVRALDASKIAVLPRFDFNPNGPGRLTR